MANPIRRGQASSQVSSWSPSSSGFTPNQQTSFFLPHGLQLRHTVETTGSVTIPSGVTWVYAICVGGFFGATLSKSTLVACSTHIACALSWYIV